MKRLLFLCVLLLAAISVSAQVSYGVKAGVGVSRYVFSIDDVSLKLNPGDRTGYYVGGVVNYALNDKVGVQSELLYENGGARLAGDGVILNWLLDPDPLFGSMEFKMNTHSIVLPVLLKYETSDGLSFLIGPYASYRVKTSVKFNDNLSNLMLENELYVDDIVSGKAAIKEYLDNSIEKFNYGVSIGLEYKMENGFFVDARFNQGLKNLWDDDSESISDVIDTNALKLVVRNSSLMVGVGFRF